MARTTQYYIDRLGSLKTERESFIPLWKDLSAHYLPRAARFLTTDRNRADRVRANKIINEAGLLALRTLSAGMMSGMTNPARPWINLKVPDPDLNRYRPVKLWLGVFRDRMLELMLRSNIYTTFPMVYRDQGCYGTTAYLLMEDEESMFRSYHWPIGSFMLAQNEKQRINTGYREFEMTARNMVREFGKENCSNTVRKLADQPAGKETWIPIGHAVEENDEYDPRKRGFSYYKRYTSCYFEYDNSNKIFLRESGFDYFPILAPRWDVNGEDIYGNSPGMDALGTTKQMQARERRKAHLIDKGSNPPMGAPASMKNKRSSVLPGDVTYYEQTAIGQKFEPLYIPDPRFYSFVLEDIKSCSERVRRAFFEDLFLMMANDYRSNITAREIAERHEEKLLQLGPVLLRQNDEHYDPLVASIAGLMFKNGVVPPAPPELNGQSLSVEYNSILSQAMKLVGVASIERLTSYVGTVAAGKPGAADWFDEDKAIQIYAESIGAPEVLIRDERVVQKMREDAAKQQQAIMAAKMATPAAETLKTLSDAKMGDDSILSRMAGQAGGQQQQGTVQ